jgi:hypothetical protein
MPSYHLVGTPETYSFGFATFNHPVTNNTEWGLRYSYNGSWIITIRSSLVASSLDDKSEAELAFAPSYPEESKAIPTLIIQERADGLLRVEYFAQSWPNTYGLVLYNSTSPGWTGNASITLKFLDFGEPSAINPEIAPRANGNLTVSIGHTVVVSRYPIAWASLADVYLYGIRGSSFADGTLTFSVQELARS